MVSYGTKCALRQSGTVDPPVLVEPPPAPSGSLSVVSLGTAGREARRSHASTIAHGKNRAPSAPLSWVAMVACASFIYFPFLTGSVVSTQLGLAISLSLFVIAETAAQRQRTASFAFALLAVALLAAASVVTTIYFPAIMSAEAVSRAQQIIVLIPLAALATLALAHSPRRQGFLRLFIRFGLVSAALGIFEFVTASSLFGRTALLSSLGGGKAIVAVEHPLVLGTLLATSVALVRPSGIRAPRVAGAILTLGAAATNAIGPTIIALLLLLHLVIPAISRLLHRYARMFAVLVWCTVVTVWALAVNVWTPVILADNLNGYSAEYRVAIYALLPDMLREAPFGYGIESLPPGLWAVPSALRGERDVSLTIDAQPVFLASMWGWAGIVLFLITVGVSLFGLRRRYQAGLYALSITVSGGFLAIAWPSLVILSTIALIWCVLPPAVPRRPPVPPSS